jgi:hypothetical protein
LPDPRIADELKQGEDEDVLRIQTRTTGEYRGSRVGLEPPPITHLASRKQKVATDGWITSDHGSSSCQSAERLAQAINPQVKVGGLVARRTNLLASRCKWVARSDIQLEYAATIWF